MTVTFTVVEAFDDGRDPLPGAMFRLYRVTGPSMAPALSAGDVLVLRRKRAKQGDVVVVRHAEFGTIVKRIDERGNLSGDSPASTAVRDLGPYDPATLIGVAVIKITPSGLQRLSARRSGSRASGSE